MMAFFKQYNQRLQHQHGWEVELDCPVCGNHGPPDYAGWTPDSGTCFGTGSTIFANVCCPRCGQDLKQQAGEKLIELFSHVPTPARNRCLVALFIGILVGLPLLLCAVIWAGVQLGWWGHTAYLALTGLSLLLPPAIFWFNWQIHGVRHRCDCGRPAYVFMGLLGRSYCYRCSTCGKLLRLQD
ncbi:MAG: hypothetical protein KJ000_09060 [Pirellulaceae bacterium]|nr:hypothetical protein [Pirellulaceae bacterium]